MARRVGEIEAWARSNGLGPERCVAYAADVKDVHGFVAAARRCIEQQGLPDAVIASAGISVGMDTAVREDLDVMADTFAINNVGMAATFHPFVGAMRTRGSGTLVGIASVSAIRGLPGHGAYCASKAAVVAYCESLRGECRGSGVRVVTLLPGWVVTPLTAGNAYRMPFMLEADVATGWRISRRQSSGGCNGPSWRHALLHYEFQNFGACAQGFDRTFLCGGVLESRISLGGGAGMASVSLEQSYAMTSAGTAALEVGDYIEKASASVLMWNAYLIGEMLFVDTTTVALEMGYRSLKVGSLTSQKATAITGNQDSGGTLLNGDGSARAFDFGGAYVNLTFRFYL